MPLLVSSGADPWFSFGGGGGGGRKRLCARTHITSGRGPESTYGPWKLSGEGGGGVDALICDPASQNHQKVARHGFLVKGRF